MEYKRPSKEKTKNMKRRTPARKEKLFLRRWLRKKEERWAAYQDMLAARRSTAQGLQPKCKAQPPPKVAVLACRDFVRGRCGFGKRCRFAREKRS